MFCTRFLAASRSPFENANVPNDRAPLYLRLILTDLCNFSSWWPEAEVTTWEIPQEALLTERRRRFRRPYPVQSPGSSSSPIEDSRISSRILYSVWRPRVSASSTSRHD